MQLGQPRSRLRALLIDQAAAGVPVEAERVTGPAAAVQGRHLVRDERLVQRVLAQQVLQLADQIGVPAKLQVTPDPLEDGGPALLVEAVTHPRHPVAADARQRRAAPEPVRVAQQGGRVIAVAVGRQRIRLPAQPAEVMQVDRVGIDVELVTPGAPGQPGVVAHGLPERGAQPGDVNRKALPGLGRGLRIPDPLDKDLGGHDRAGRQ